MTRELPFLPFSRPTIDEATIAAVGDVLRSGWITSGPKVREFEERLSAYFGARRSGTAVPCPPAGRINAPGSTRACAA